MAISFKQAGQVETTLPEAIKLCKKYGGDMRTAYNDGIFVYNLRLDVMEDQKGYRKHTYPHHEITAVWVYEPPKESAFKKWSRNITVTSQNNLFNEAVQKGRKEGWNAAIDAVCKESNRTTGIDRCATIAQIKALRED